LNLLYIGQKKINRILQKKSERERIKKFYSEEHKNKTIKTQNPPNQ